MRLFGKKKNVKIHTAQELNCISLSCNHMNYNYCYSFFAEKKNEVWLFSAKSKNIFVGRNGVLFWYGL